MFQVLYEYVREGTVGVVQNWGKGLPQHSTHYFGQTLSINECVYRNMYRVKYLVFTDLDEFIVPRKSLGWPGMMKKIENLKYGAFIFRHSYFLGNNRSKELDTKENVKTFTCNGSRVEFPRFLTHTTRSRKVYPQKEKSKYIIKPLHSCIIGIHEIFKHVEENIVTFVVPPGYGLLHHYRVFQGGLHSVSRAVLEDVKHQKRIPDNHALVYQEKIIARLRKRLCRS